MGIPRSNLNPSLPFAFCSHLPALSLHRSLPAAGQIWISWHGELRFFASSWAYYSPYQHPYRTSPILVRLATRTIHDGNYPKDEQILGRQTKSGSTFWQPLGGSKPSGRRQPLRLPRWRLRVRGPGFRHVRFSERGPPVFGVSSLFKA